MKLASPPHGKANADKTRGTNNNVFVAEFLIKRKGSAIADEPRDALSVWNLELLHNFWRSIKIVRLFDCRHVLTLGSLSISYDRKRRWEKAHIPNDSRSTRGSKNMTLRWLLKLIHQGAELDRRRIVISATALLCPRQQRDNKQCCVCLSACSSVPCPYLNKVHFRATCTGWAKKTAHQIHGHNSVKS